MFKVTIEKGYAIAEFIFESFADASAFVKEALLGEVQEYKYIIEKVEEEE